uniref:Uncharacterized protein n=1 Tax=Megaselia scalaris TaxID=36166 RepID=T1GYL0_MEGSC
MDWKKLTVGIVVPTYGVISGKKSINLHGFIGVLKVDLAKRGGRFSTLHLHYFGTPGIDFFGGMHYFRFPSLISSPKNLATPWGLVQRSLVVCRPAHSIEENPVFENTNGNLLPIKQNSHSHESNFLKFMKLELLCSKNLSFILYSSSFD